VLQSLDDQIVFAPRWPASPFPGLRPFRVTATEDESLIFYGRNRAKDEILARLNSSHLVFVVGPSGCGKSSLLKVGVIPNPIDQNPWAHWRSPMDMMRQGWSTSLFHAAQQWSTRSS